MAQEPKIPDESKSFLVLLGTLNAQLVELHQLAAEGEWDKLSLVAPNFEATAVDLHAAPVPAQLGVSAKKMLQETESLLQSAVNICAERQEQIQPLITAFNDNALHKPLP